MHWQEILTILVPILGLMSWVYNRIEKKIEKTAAETNARLDKIDTKLDNLNIRLTRLEGRFDERGYWESRKTGTHDEK